MDLYGNLLQAVIIASLTVDLTLSDMSLVTIMEHMEQVEYCGYLGGTCSTDTCRRVLRHRWGLSLCHNSRFCCAERLSSTSLAPSPNPVGVTNAPSTECGRSQGVCQAWYNNCSGTVAQLECNNAWESCCTPSTPQQSTSNGELPSISATTLSPTTGSQSTSPGSTTEEDSDDLVDNPNQQRLMAGQCGQQFRAPRQKRIVGGSLSQSGTWPWHVGISSALGYIHCAGTIVNNTWILTAAHCFKRIRNHSLYRVVTGTHPEQTQTSYSIKRIVKHTLYREHNHVELVGHSHKYDIALVELNESIAYSQSVQPACLPLTTADYEGETCWLTGWGSTRYNSTEDAFRLRHVEGRVLSQSQCVSHWGDLVDSKMLCFGNKLRGGCTGDSGGGMFCQNNDGHYTIAGVISWGSAQCNQRATVLTDIAQYHSWIEETMNG